MMCAGIYVEAPDWISVDARRVEQAAAAGIRLVITWRHNCPQAAWRQHGDRPGLREDSRRGWGRGHQALLRRGQCARLRRARSHSGYPDLLAGYQGLPTVPKNQDCGPASERSTTTSCSRLLLRT